MKQELASLKNAKMRKSSLKFQGDASDRVGTSEAKMLAPNAIAPFQCMT